MTITTILTRLISPVEREAIRRSEASGETPKPLFQAAALEFCARKVASVSGDLRRALDLMRQAVNIAESEAPSNTLVQVSVGHILKAEQASAGSPAFKAIQALPLNAQVLLVSILHLLSKSTSLTITQVF
ncbi:AAA ATPase [Massospora cicadina]|nr:AAA ATPase [Massospora cicadina]